MLAHAPGMLAEVTSRGQAGPKGSVHHHIRPSHGQCGEASMSPPSREEGAEGSQGPATCPGLHSEGQS